MKSFSGKITALNLERHISKKSIIFFKKKNDFLDVTMSIHNIFKTYFFLYKKTLAGYDLILF